MSYGKKNIALSLMLPTRLRRPPFPLLILLSSPRRSLLLLSAPAALSALLLPTPPRRPSLLRRPRQPASPKRIQVFPPSTPDFETYAAKLGADIPNKKIDFFVEKSFASMVEDEKESSNTVAAESVPAPADEVTVQSSASESDKKITTHSKKEIIPAKKYTPTATTTGKRPHDDMSWLNADGESSSDEQAKPKKAKITTGSESPKVFKTQKELDLAALLSSDDN